MTYRATAPPRRPRSPTHQSRKRASTTPSSGERSLFVISKPWGAGVYRTRDRGQAWQRMGLRGFEVSALAVDFIHKRAYAGAGSGVYELGFD